MDDAWPKENLCPFGRVARSQAKYPQSPHLCVGNRTGIVADQENISTLMCQYLNVGNNLWTKFHPKRLVIPILRGVLHSAGISAPKYANTITQLWHHCTASKAISSLSTNTSCKSSSNCVAIHTQTSKEPMQCCQDTKYPGLRMSLAVVHLIMNYYRLLSHYNFHLNIL